MHIFNNKARYYTQAFIIEAGKATGNATVKSANAVAKAALMTTNTTVDVAKATKGVVSDARVSHKATKEAKTFRNESLKAQGIK